MAFSQVVMYVNVVALAEQNVGSELCSQNREVEPEAGAGGPFMSEAVAGYCLPSCQPHLHGFLKNGYNTFYHKGILKMEQQLGGVEIPQSKTFTSELTGWGERGTPCHGCLSWPTGPAGAVRARSGHRAKGSSFALTPTIYRDCLKTFSKKVLI